MGVCVCVCVLCVCVCVVGEPLDGRGHCFHQFVRINCIATNVNTINRTHHSFAVEGCFVCVLFPAVCFEVLHFRVCFNSGLPGK